MDYTKDNIQALDILSHVRLRPNAYISDMRKAGQFHAIKEITDNSIDELENCNYDNKLLNITLVFDLEEESYLFVVEDNGRGIPLEKLQDIFSKNFISGKFDTDAYEFSGGLLGIGAKVSVSLSEITKIFSFRDGKSRSLTVKYDDDKFNIKSSRIKKFQNDHGTFSIFKLDKTVFLDTDKWILGEYDILLDYVKKLSVFLNGEYRIRFKILNNSKLVRNLERLDLNAIRNKMNKSEVLIDYDSSIFDKGEYIKEIFNVSLYDAHQIQIQYKHGDLDLFMNLIIDISNQNYPNIIADKNRIAFINKILIDDNASYHIKYLRKYLKGVLSKNIADKNMKEFFLKQYTLPIFYLIDIKFSKAQFVGTTKHAFKDDNFKKAYLLALNEKLTTKLTSEIYLNIADHITIQYNKFGNKKLQIKNSRKLLLELERFDKYDGCLSKDCSKNELFLVEGDSAKSTDGRDSNHQALYALGGKTLNSLIEKGKEHLSLQKIKSNVIFRDIIKLINIIPGSTDMSDARFGKILILTDADDHGFHIASVIIGNLMILYPKLIEEGYVYIVISPLYNVRIPKINKVLYLKSNRELTQALTENFYSKKIKLFQNGTMVTGDDLSNVISDIVSIGGIFQNISDEINIPGEIIEMLYKISNILTEKKLTPKDIKKIKRSIHADTVFYEEDEHTLIISFDIIDYIIPLRIFISLYERIDTSISKFDTFKYKYSTSFVADNFVEVRPCLIFEIYQILNELDKSVQIDRNKGIGHLDVEEKKITCMDVDTRITKRITSMGDIDIIYNLLGSDSSYRKEILSKEI